MTIGLVFHHLFAIPNSDYFPRQSLTMDTLTLANVLNGLGHWTTMAAVPLLSIVSGYLYFGRPIVQHRLLLTRRIRSIILPSLAWTSLWFAVGYLLVTAGRPYGLFQWLDYGFENLRWHTPLNGIIGVTRAPLAFQFWFIHDLVLALILAPLIGLLLKRWAIGLLIALSGLWLFNAIPYPFFSGNVLYFFVLGAFLATRSTSLVALAQSAQRWQLIIASVFTLLLVARLVQDLHPAFASHLWLCLLRLAGVATLGVFIYQQLQRPDSWMQRLSNCSPYAFFIFASHYPLIEFFKVVVERIPLQDSAVGQNLSLVLIPTATVITCIIAAKITARYLPRLFSFVNGGRDLRVPGSTAQTRGIPNAL